MVGFFVCVCLLFRHSLKRSFLGPCFHWEIASKEIVWKECWKTRMSNLQWWHANAAPSEQSCSPTTKIEIKFPPRSQHETSQGIPSSYSSEDYLKHLWCHGSNHSLYCHILKKPGNFQQVQKVTAGSIFKDNYLPFGMHFLVTSCTFPVPCGTKPQRGNF